MAKEMSKDEKERANLLLEHGSYKYWTKYRPQHYGYLGSEEFFSNTDYKVRKHFLN